MLISLDKKTIKDEYPYNVVEFEHLNLNAPVVFFTGENGTGKSTLLRIISQLTSSINVSKSTDYGFEKYNGYSASWDLKLKKGYYFQSEDFYSFLNWIEDEEEANQTLYEEAIIRHGEKESIGKMLETEMHKGNTKRLNNMVNEFKKASHGEGYIRFFSSKLRAKTLYLLDEPETPLSFQNQLTLLSLINQFVNEGSQFIICTHSPILLAYPNALIYHFDNDISEVEYSKHPIINDYISFLNNPNRYMRYLFTDETE